MSGQPAGAYAEVYFIIRGTKGRPDQFIRKALMPKQPDYLVLSSAVQQEQPSQATLHTLVNTVGERIPQLEYTRGCTQQRINFAVLKLVTAVWVDGGLLDKIFPGVEADQMRGKIQAKLNLSDEEMNRRVRVQAHWGADATRVLNEYKAAQEELAAFQRALEGSPLQSITCTPSALHRMGAHPGVDLNPTNKNADCGTPRQATQERLERGRALIAANVERNSSRVTVTNTNLGLIGHLPAGRLKFTESRSVAPQTLDASQLSSLRFPSGAGLAGLAIRSPLEAQALGAVHPGLLATTAQIKEAMTPELGPLSDPADSPTYVPKIIMGELDHLIAMTVAGDSYAVKQAAIKVRASLETLIKMQACPVPAPRTKMQP